MKKLTTAALFGTMVFLSFITAVQGALLTDIINFFHPESSAQGLPVFLASVGGMVSLASTFFLIGRLPKFRLLEIGIMICCVFLCGVALAKTFFLFLSAWFAVGIGIGYMDALISSCIADLYTGKDATRTMCNLHTTAGISSMIAPIIYSALKSAGVQWNHLYYVISVFGLFMFAVMILVANKTLSSHTTETVHTENKMNFQETVSHLISGRFPFLLLAIFMHGIFLGGLNSWLTHYVSVTLNGKLGSIALSFLFFGVLISRFLFPFTGFDRTKYLSRAGFLAGIVFAAALPFSSDVVVCVAAALCALCFGAMIPCLLNEACADMPETTLLATTSMVLCLYLGQGLASPILGAFEKGAGLRYGMFFCSGIMILTSAVLSIKKVHGEIE
ncbi:MAG: MFS transporter [Eubacteriales bacterium]|nr:MFS transporter [Eubacteriales bacterium]